MHVRLTLFLLLWLGMVLPSHAQLYTGAGSLRLVSAGQEATTTLESARLTAQYTCAESNFLFMIKTAVLGMESGAAQATLVEEVLMAPSNPLLKIELEGAPFSLNCDDFPTGLKAQPISLQLSFHGETLTLPGQLKVQATAETISLELEASFSLAAFGLYARPPHRAVFGDTVTLSLRDVILTRR